MLANFFILKKLFLFICIALQAPLFAQTLTSNVTSLPSFNNCLVNWASAAQKFTVSGTNLTDIVTVTPSSNFEISTNCINQFSSVPLVLTPQNGIVPNTIIYVRLSPEAIGAKNGNITVNSKNANALSINILGSGVNYSIPTTNGGYYGSTIGLNGASLKTALFNKITNHSVTSYSGLWSTYSTTDAYVNGKVWDIYSTNICGTSPYEFTFGTNQCGNYSKEGDCYNREHSFPQSWFGSATPMVSDMFHIYPTDGKVNGMRDNWPYGEVSAPTYTSQQGGKLGPCVFPGYSGTVFEPLDEYKGDLARGYFYMATRYENLIANWQNNGNANEVLNGNSFPVFDQWVIDLFVKWHNQDPVSAKEINRNNAIFGYQQNRNPYIDSPQFVNRIWGGASANKPTLAASKVQVDLTSTSPNIFNLKWQSGNGNKRIVVVKANEPVDQVPADSFEYIANANFGNGDDLGNGNFLVYNGMGSACNIANCETGITYYYAIFEYNGVGKTAQYLANASFGSFSTVSVGLVNFTAQLASDKTALLEWKTNFERNNDKFIIERSLDTANWENRAQVKSVGNSVVPTFYSHTDSLPVIGNIKQTVYYRLKQVDLDSTKYTYSPTKSVIMDHTDVKNASQMSAEWLLQPNPFTNQLRISVNLFSQNQIHITIKNTLGNDVFKLSQNIYQGQHVIVVNQLDILPAGIYFVQLQCGNHTEQKRIIKY